MRFSSTRDETVEVSLSEALAQGLAPDGGLFVPRALPRVDPSGAVGSLPEEAVRFLRPFFAGDPLEPELEAICESALGLPCPLRPFGRDHFVLELFHGPTAAFKDFGARFLAACVARLRSTGSTPSSERTVMVATSGDTGGAVAAAFAEQPGARVWILYPEGRVSERQEAQLTSWGDRVLALRVAGSFDDCQRIVKEAFGDRTLRARFGLTSANSINVGRLLPQAAYHWYAARCHHARTGRPLRAIIPTGNLGHGLAAIWAREVGAPIQEVVLALNANRAVLDQLETGRADPRPAIPTLANAMDVGIPSNLERLNHLYPDPAALRSAIRAQSFDDEAIRETIRNAEERYGWVPCPHTACALLALEELGTPGWTVVATAHAAKFDTVVDPLIGRPVPPPSALAELLTRPRVAHPVAPTLDAVLSVTAGS